MPLKVIESKKEFDWSVNKPVEFRPYIKDIAGKRRMFFLSTVSAVRDGSNQFDGSATPDLALIDSEYRDVVWIDAKHPSQWNKIVYEQLSEAWRGSENIGHYYQEKSKDSILKSTDSIKVTSKKVNDSMAIKKLQKKIDSIKAKQ